MPCVCVCVCVCDVLNTVCFVDLLRPTESSQEATRRRLQWMKLGGSSQHVFLTVLLSSIYLDFICWHLRHLTWCLCGGRRKCAVNFVLTKGLRGHCPRETYVHAAVFNAQAKRHRCWVWLFVIAALLSFSEGEEWVSKRVSRSYLIISGRRFFSSSELQPVWETLYLEATDLIASLSVPVLLIKGVTCYFFIISSDWTTL